MYTLCYRTLFFIHNRIIVVCYSVLIHFSKLRVFNRESYFSLFLRTLSCSKLTTVVASRVTRDECGVAGAGVRHTNSYTRVNTVLGVLLGRAKRGTKGGLLAARHSTDKEARRELAFAHKSASARALGGGGLASHSRRGESTSSRSSFRRTSNASRCAPMYSELSMRHSDASWWAS